MSATLRELIGDERHALDALLEEHEGEVTPEIGALWSELDDKIANKVESWGLWITRQGSVCDAIDAEITRLKTRKAVAERAIAASKAELQRQMEAAGLDKVKGVLVTVAVQANNPSVAGELDTPTLNRLGVEGSPFARVVPIHVVLDKKAVLEAAKAGQPIPDGLSIVRSHSLRIR
jgi:hypothetical protein